MPQGLLKRLAVYFTLVLASVALTWAAWIHFCVLRATGPLEYREDGILLLTDFLRRGGNPYAVQNVPLYTAVYGIGYHVLVIPFTWLMGGGYFTHRLVSGVFAVGSCALVGWTLRKSGVTLGAAFVGGVLLYLDLAARSSGKISPNILPETIIARPDAMGLFLFLASLLIPWKYRFTNRSLAASTMLAMAAFLTKPYFILGLAVVISYVFLFRAMTRGVAWAAAGAVTFAAILAIGTWLGPCFYAIIISGNGNAGKYSSVPHLWEQLAFYGKSIPGCLLLAMMALVVLVKGSFGDAFQSGSQPIEGDEKRVWQGPLISWDVDFFVFAMFISILVLLLRLGEHTGNSMLYFYQLLSPLLIIVALRWIGAPARWGSWWTFLLAADLMLFLASKPIAPADHTAEWAEWRSLLVDRHDAYVPPPLAWMAHEQGLPVFDSGMSEYFDNTLAVSRYPSKEVLMQQCNQFIGDAQRRLAIEDYDVIVIPLDGDTPMFNFLNIAAVEERYAAVGRMSFSLDWEPSLNGLVYVRKSMLAPVKK